MTIRPETVAAFVELQLSHLTPPAASSRWTILWRTSCSDIQTYLQGVQDSVRALFGFVLEQIDARARARGRPFHELDLAGRQGRRRWSSSGTIRCSTISCRWSLARRAGDVLARARPRPRRLPPCPTDTRNRTCHRQSHQRSTRHTTSAWWRARVPAVCCTPPGWRRKGAKVLIVDDGPWMSPRNLSRGDDQALRQLYRNAAVQPALPRLDSVLRPGGFAFINVLQARVFGGGPMVNNAIHLRIPQGRSREWRDQFEFPVELDSLKRGLDQVALDLDISPAAAQRSRGWRTSAFVEGARRLGLRVDDLDLSVVAECIGCGGCNVGCRFGLKTGGLHGNAQSGKPSYL